MARTESRRKFHRVALAAGGHSVLSLRCDGEETRERVFRMVTSDAPNAEPRVIGGETRVEVTMTPGGQGGRAEDAEVEVSEEELRAEYGVVQHKRFVAPEGDKWPVCSDFYSVWMENLPDEREILNPTNEEHLRRPNPRDNPDGALWFRCKDKKQAIAAAEARAKFFNRLHNVRKDAYLKTTNKNEPYVLVVVVKGGAEDAKARFYYEEPPERNILDIVLKLQSGNPRRQATQARAFAVHHTGKDALKASNEHIKIPVVWNTTVQDAMAFLIDGRSQSEIVNRDGGLVWFPPGAVRE